MFACKPNPVIPTVKTTAVTDITESSAKSGGDVTADGGAEVTSRGICWSKNQTPTIIDNRTDDGIGMGAFHSSMTDLEDSTIYYLRAYAINDAGVAYGDELSFMTLAIEDDSEDNSEDDSEILLPTVTSSCATNITETSACSGGNVTDDGGAEVTARGICWSTEQNPTLSDNHTTDGNGAGSFTSIITDLNPNTKYYARAYATNEKGTAYGEEINFTTLEKIVIGLPEVKTVSATDVDIHNAVITGEVISDGGAEVVERGFIWNILDDDNGPTESQRVEVGSGLGVFTYQFTDLLPETEYSVQAYAINSEGEANGEYIFFTTLEDEAEENLINGYEYVDLGLPSGLKWATQNVGASSPTESGNYYAWGEIEPKEEYTEANNVTNNLPLTQISGDTNYDAAAVRWGETWRIPTREEMEELRDECSWIWSIHDNVLGYKVVGPNGNQIFLPASGFVFVTTPYFYQQYGYYWTSVSGSENYMGAFSLCFGNESVDVAWYFRYAGLTIRPVSD